MSSAEETGVMGEQIKSFFKKVIGGTYRTVIFGFKGTCFYLREVSREL